VRKHQIGEGGPDLTVVAYGGRELGSRADQFDWLEDRLVAAILTAFHAGINWVDTAEIYGAGQSERVIGKACGEWDGKVFIASKLAPIPSSSGSGYEPWQVRWGTERTLTRLGRDRIDAYMLHWPDQHVDVRETWQAMASLVEDGLLGIIGLSNFPRELVEVCEGIRHVDFVEVEFSLLNQRAAELLAWCQEQGIAGLAYGSLGYGILTGARRALPADSGNDWFQHIFAPDRFPSHLRLADGLAALAHEYDCTTGQLALAWTLHQPGVDCVVAGSRDPQHIKENALAGVMSLSAEQLDRINDVVSETRRAARSSTTGAPR
jgi:methylglyoxal reductase